EITDARETLGQHVLKKASEKFFTSESHRPFLVVILVIPPTEADLGLVDRKKPVIGDGDAIQVPSSHLYCGRAHGTTLRKYYRITDSGLLPAGFAVDVQRTRTEFDRKRDIRLGRNLTMVRIFYPYI